jgi:hypothetical protein
MDKHSSNLRRTRADMLGTDDEEHYLECHAAAEEIDRLNNLIEMSDGLKCPNEDCGDLGYTPEQNAMGDWYQERCEWCHSVDESVYWRNQQ